MTVRIIRQSCEVDLDSRYRPPYSARLMSFRSGIPIFLPTLVALVCAQVGSSILTAKVEGRPQASSPQQPPSGLVLLRSGRILRGSAVRDGNVFVVRLLGGEIRVPHEKVLLVCDSLDDAYRLQHQNLTSKDPDEHVRLARWCLSNGLARHARTELQEALRLDPTRRDAQVMLRRLPRTSLEPSSGLRKKSSTPPKSFKRPMQKLAPEGTASTTPLPNTADLPRFSRKAFAVSIQPMLIRSCSRSGCHNSKITKSFRLESLPRTRRGKRNALEANFRSVLKYVDFEHPAESPLLLVPMRKHGRAARPIISDPNDLGYRMLAAWVFAICERPEAARAMLPELPEKPAKQSKPLPIKVLPPNIKQSVEKFTVPPIGANHEDRTDKKDRSDEINPYDPESFNQAFLKKLLETLGKKK